LPRSSETLMNLEAALDRVDGDREFLDEMAGMFLKDSSQLMNRIRDGIAGGDLSRAGNAAHTLKNWASGFCAPEVYQAAELVERQLDSGSSDGTEWSCKSLETCLEQLALELDRYSKPAPG
jgi:HPt (histidine-containing phosphotransfer) domain-containing protein